jgi:hypothetical protein
MLKCSVCGKIYFHPFFKECGKCWGIRTRNAGTHSCYVRDIRWWVYDIIDFIKSQWMIILPLICMVVTTIFFGIIVYMLNVN